MRGRPMSPIRVLGAVIVCTFASVASATHLEFVSCPFWIAALATGSSPTGAAEADFARAGIPDACRPLTNVTCVPGTNSDATWSCSGRGQVNALCSPQPYVYVSGVNGRGVPNSGDGIITVTNPETNRGSCAYWADDWNSPKNRGSPDCPKAGCPATNSIGDPVNITNGNNIQREVDYSAGKDGGLEMARFYNSMLPAPQVGFAVGWEHTWSRRLFIAGSVIRAIRADGRAFNFMQSGSNWVGDADIPEQLQSSGSDWVLTTRDNEVETYDSSGTLLSIRSSTGKLTTLVYSDGTASGSNGATYDGSTTPLAVGMLIRVVDFGGRALSLTYRLDGNITRMTDPDGGIYVYSYDSFPELTSVQYPDGTIRTYVYNESANTSGANLPFALTGIIDENGARYATFKYSSARKAISTEHAGGVENYQFTYNTSSTSYLDPLGASKSSPYTPILGVLQTTGIAQTCTGCGGTSAATFTFDANRNVSSIKDFNGNLTCFTFGSRNLEIARTEGLSGAGTCDSPVTTSVTRTISTRWHSVWRLPVQQAEPLRITTYAYNGDPGVSCAPAGASTTLLCTKTIQATTDTTGQSAFSALPDDVPARTWSYTYDANGLLLTIDRPRNDVSDVTTFTYDASGNLATVTDALGHITQYPDYFPSGRLQHSIDPNGLETWFTYDARGHLKTRRVMNAASSIDETTQYDYYATENLKRITQPDASFIEFTYDDAHRLSRIDDNLGDYITYTLDPMGNHNEEDTHDPGGNLTKKIVQDFDQLNRLSDTKLAGGATTKFSYDPNGNLEHVTPPASLGRPQTTNVYDALNRIADATDSNNATTGFGYNGLDQLTQVTDPLTFVTNYDFDGLGNQRSLTSPDTGFSTFRTDDAGNVQIATDAWGRTGTSVYDSLNRVASTTYSDETVIYTYDQGPYGVGHLTGISDSSGQTTFTYDAVGRLKTDTRSVDGLVAVVTYGYDSFGRLASITYPSGRQVTYSFDALGRVSAINLVANGITMPIVSGVTYEPFGGLGGYTVGSIGPVYSRGHNLDGFVSSFTLGSIAYQISYDDASNITKISNPADTSTDLLYAYDPDDRLWTFTTSPATLNQTFQYDANGNRKKLTQNGIDSVYAISPTSNRLDNVDGVIRTYDASGNQLTGPTFGSTTYSDRGRMIQATTTGGLTAYSVNALGERVKKTSGGVSTYFDYDKEGHLIGEYDAGGAVLRETVWLGDTPVTVLSAQTALAGAVDDFDADATPDVIFRDTNGDLYGDYMNPDYSPKFNPFPLLASVATNFDLVGITDLDGDGRPDIVWRDTTTGDVSAWLSTSPNPAYLFTMDLDYKVAGFGDFNGDGKNDMVITSRSTRSVAVMYLNGTQYLSSEWFASIPSGYSAAAVADFNADGSPDIIVQYLVDGSAFAWYFAGTQYIGGDYLGTPDVLMNITRVGDFNRDGRADIVARDPVTKDAVVYYFDGATSLGSASFYSITPAYDQEPLTENLQKILASGGGAPLSSAFPPSYTPPSMVRRPGVASPTFVRPPNLLPFNVSTSLAGRRASMPPKPSGSKRLMFTKDTPGPQPFAVYDVYSDHLNTPRLITRRSDGKAVWRWDNVDPFGANAAQDNPNGFGVFTFNLRFPGQYYDQETATNYNYFRDYDPSIGRYVESDPIGLKGGINSYAYVLDDPLVFLDRLGLAIGDYPPPPPGYNPDTWGHGTTGDGRSFVKDPNDRMWIAHPEDKGHWRHWDKPDDPDNPRWPPNSLKPWPGQKRGFKPNQCTTDPSGDAPPWSPPADPKFDPMFDSPDSPFYTPPIYNWIFGPRFSAAPRAPLFRFVAP